MGRALRFAENFAQNLERLQSFLLDRDAASAPARFSALLEDVERAGRLLVDAPELGRRAAFLASRAPRVLRLAKSLQELGDAVQARELREVVLRGYLVLYAVRDDEVVFLAIRAQRERSYGL